MTTFKQYLEKFLVYFFTGVSLVIVVLGINRTKDAGSLGSIPSPESNSGTIDNSVAGMSTTAKKPTTITAKGKTYQTPWGNLATTIKVKDGKVIAVEIPSLPDSPPSINARPYLIDQAIRSGSADIQGVSGATITSRAFKASLESALAQAAVQGAAVSPDTLVSLAYVNTQPSTQQNTAVAPTTQSSASKTTTQGVSGVSGTFTGDPYQTPWGNAVASVTYTNGKITGVTMPQVPNSPPSIQAESYLIQQALAAGNANIQGVSGATYASIAFKSSLESAIAKAGAQGTIATPTPSAATATQKQTIPAISRKYHDDDWSEDDDERYERKWGNEWDD